MRHNTLLLRHAAADSSAGQLALIRATGGVVVKGSVAEVQAEMSLAPYPYQSWDRVNQGLRAQLILLLLLGSQLEPGSRVIYVVIHIQALHDHWVSWQRVLRSLRLCGRES